MLKVLKNPVTSNYVDLKEFILSNDFVWRYDTSTGMPFYGHTFLERPEETGFSQPLSELVNLNLTVLKEIIDFKSHLKVLADQIQSFGSQRRLVSLSLLLPKQNTLSWIITFTSPVVSSGTRSL